MSLPSVLRYVGVFVLTLIAGSASAQQLAAPYGGPIDGDTAKKIAAAALAEARKNKRPTKAFQDALAAGGVEMRYLGLRGVVPAEGGVPIVMDGKLVGAIGVSGGTGAQDERCAEAGMAALK